MRFKVAEKSPNTYHLLARGSASHSYEEVESAFHVRAKEICVDKKYEFELNVDSVTDTRYDQYGGSGESTSFRIQGPLVCGS